MEGNNRPTAEDELRNLRHEVGNALYSIVLQARCAGYEADDGQVQAVKESLGKIELAVGQTYELVDDLVAVATGEDPRRPPVSRR